MAARKKRTAKDIGKPQVSPGRAVELLRAQHEKGSELLAKGFPSADEHSKWELLTGNLLGKAFGENSPNVNAILSVDQYGSFPMDAGEEWWSQHRAESLRTQLTKLEGLIELLETEVELDSEGVIHKEDKPHGRKVFLVHGHDEGALHGTARFLDKIEQ